MSKGSAERLTLVHRSLGIALLAFLGFHAWQLVSAPRGRFAFVERFDATMPPLAISLAIVLPIWLGHTALGLRSIGPVRSGDAGSYATSALRGLQLGAGLLVLVFLGAHLFHVWRLRLDGATAIDLYERLRDDLPRPAFALLYLAGATAVGLHVTQGIAAAIRASGRIQGGNAAVVERTIGLLVAGALFVVFLHVLCHFVTGQGLFGAPRIADVETVEAS